MRGTPRALASANPQIYDMFAVVDKNDRLMSIYGYPALYRDRLQARYACTLVGKDCHIVRASVVLKPRRRK